GDVLESFLRAANLSLKLARRKVDEVAMRRGVTPDLESEIGGLSQLPRRQEAAASEKPSGDIKGCGAAVSGEERRCDHEVALASVVERQCDERFVILVASRRANGRAAHTSA